jgi:hypothetical protein
MVGVLVYLSVIKLVGANYLRWREQPTAAAAETPIRGECRMLGEPTRNGGGRDAMTIAR